jgi:hypothetical protein
MEAITKLKHNDLMVTLYKDKDIHKGHHKTQTRWTDDHIYKSRYISLIYIFVQTWLAERDDMLGTNKVMALEATGPGSADTISDGRRFHVAEAAVTSFNHLCGLHGSLHRINGLLGAWHLLHAQAYAALQNNGRATSNKGLAQFLSKGDHKFRSLDLLIGKCE